MDEEKAGTSQDEGIKVVVAKEGQAMTIEASASSSSSAHASVVPPSSARRVVQAALPCDGSTRLDERPSHPLG